MNRRIKLSFNKVEFARLKLGNAGVIRPLADTETLKQNFNIGDKTVMESFGFFGPAGDPNKFYPGINVPEDVMPKPEDFVRVPFRLLSATTVGAGSWKATDFSKPGVLEASVEKLKGKPIFTDHEQDVYNCIGGVESTNWDSPKGDVPGGINGLLAIDAKSNPAIARNILMKFIYSNSVTVEFNWVPSHTFSSGQEFDRMVGTMHQDGTMVRRIATEILDYHETSICWLGADPYAKLIDDNGSLVNIDTTSTYNLDKPEEQSYEKNKSYSIPMGLDKKIINLSKTQLEKSTTMNKELELALKKILGLKDMDELNLDHLKSLQLVGTSAENPLKDIKSLDKEGNEVDAPEDVSGYVLVEKESVNEFKANTESLSRISEAIKEVEGEQPIETKITALIADSKLGISLLSEKRTEVQRLYGLSVDQKTDKVMLDLIEGANLEQLESFAKQFGKGAIGKFTGSCKSCGSTEFELRSSEGGDDTGAGKEKSSSASFHDLMEKYDKPTMNPTGKKK